jgi:hypothetical protein
MRGTPLTPKQRRIVEEIATERARPCYFCSSREWRAPFVAEGSTGPWNFLVTCAVCGDGTEVFELSRDEAATRLGLRHGQHQEKVDETGG